PMSYGQANQTVKRAHVVEGKLVRETIDRQKQYETGRETYWNSRIGKRRFNFQLSGGIIPCRQAHSGKMIALAEEADEEYGRRLKEGLAAASEHTESSNHWVGRITLRTPLEKDMERIHIDELKRSKLPYKGFAFFFMGIINGCVDALPRMPFKIKQEIDWQKLHNHLN
ncbi:hypothetical protein KEH51_14180, partial [[Brevibacterium] frigoritolerans]|nr:hypothetical protein [Peribacillus frigoritolerans]